MDSHVLELLCCPDCRGELDLSSDEVSASKILFGQLLCKGCGRVFEVGYGLPNLVYPDPKELPEIDAKFRQQYKKVAASYDRTVRLMLLLFGIWEPWSRKRNFVNPLELKSGYRVLEVSTGTGSNIPIIAKQIGDEGKVYAMDLSPEMMAVARDKLHRKGINAEFALANGAHLPYKDNTFDAVLHFGGINTFGDKKGALSEMMRVARPGAKLVIGDEGLAPGKETTRFGRWLLKMNTLYAHKPPSDLIPEEAEEFKVRWIWRGAFYVMEMRKKS